MKPNIYDDYPVPSGGAKVNLPKQKKKKLTSEKVQQDVKQCEKPKERVAVKKHVRLQNWSKGTAVTDNLHSLHKTVS